MTPAQYCQEKAARSGSSFYYSFLFLPREKREAITALYAFCREVDDIADECHDPLLAETKLNWWRDELRRIYAGQPTHPVGLALLPAIKRYDLAAEHFAEIIDGMEMDLQRVRYARQILLDDVGEEGQEKLAQAKVLVIGAGGLGVPVVSYLAAAGVGTIGIADGDVVELSNLHRQIAYRTRDIGAPKTAQLSLRVRDNNERARIVEHPRVTPTNADDIVAGYDFIADGSDNFITRYLINAVCRRRRKILVSAALERFTGELATFLPDGPCYRCVFPLAPDRESAQGCVAGGILGPMAGLLGCWQALEILKQILELPGRLRGELLLFDAVTNDCRRIRLRRDPSCEICGSEPHENSVLRGTA